MKHKIFQRCIRKGIAVFMAGVAACSLLLSYTGGADVVEAATDWSQGEVWIGGTEVTKSNCDNIFNETGADGNPTAHYDLATSTLYLNGVNIRDTYRRKEGGEYKEYSLYADRLVEHLVITGENSFSEGIFEVYARSSTAVYSITGTGRVRCQGNFCWQVTEAPPTKYLIFGSEAEKTGPTIDAGNGVKVAGIGLQMYGGVIKGFSKEGKGFDHVINGTYANRFVQLYNDSMLMVRKGKASTKMPTDAYLSSSTKIVMGKNNTDYFGWVVYMARDAKNTIIGLDDLGLDPTAEDYFDTDIDVLGFTEDATVYSVDVEWGAMTFQYENTTWDAAEHKTIAGAEWKVYDSEKSKVLDTTQDAINQIKVTNHSNAEVYATLDYAGAKTDDADYTDTIGGFTKSTEDTDTQLTPKAGDVPDYLTLATADNSTDAAVAGTPTTGTVFFMPSGIKEEYKTADGIAKWSQLGTITVGIKTEKPSV